MGGLQPTHQRLQWLNPNILRQGFDLQKANGYALRKHLLAKINLKQGFMQNSPFEVELFNYVCSIGQSWLPSTMQCITVEVTDCFVELTCSHAKLTHKFSAEPPSPLQLQKSSSRWCPRPGCHEPLYHWSLLHDKVSASEFTSTMFCSNEISANKLCFAAHAYEHYFKMPAVFSIMFCLSALVFVAFLPGIMITGIGSLVVSRYLDI